jgi:L-2-hydroxyglutarate oxidase
VVGAGIVGLAVALEITNRFPGISIAVIEKESSVARHQTSHNSGVIHSGIYYKPGSLKAKLCFEGAKALVAFCRMHDIAFEACGKLIVATTEQEFPQLQELYRRGLGNGLEGLRMLGASEIHEFEPHAAGLRGIYVPSTGIVDFREVAEKYAALITLRGGSVLLSHEVVALKRAGSGTILETTKGPIEAQLAINCAGLQSDRVSRMANANLDLTIVPFRGEYYDIVPSKHYLLKSLLYPVPDPKFPFLGVHFTRRIHGGVEAGPNAVLALKREGYAKTSMNVGDIAEYLSFPGFWIMASKHWKMSFGEYHRSFSKEAFVRALQRLIPELRAEDLVSGGSGVRAQALSRAGKLIDDFHITSAEGMVHVSNVPSPAATASLAIAKYVVDTVLSTQQV